MKKGSIFCILAAIGFGVAPSVMNYMLLNGVPQVSIVMCSNFFLCVVAFLICKLRGFSLNIGIHMVLKLCLIGVMGMGITPFLLSSAYSYISVGTATVIHFLYPTVVTVASMILLHKKATIYSFAAIVLSIAGMACISLPGGSGGGSTMGFVFALVSSFSYSFYILGNEIFKAGELPLPVTLVYMAGANAAVFFIQAMLTGQFAAPSTVGLWLVLLVYCLIMGSSFGLLNLGISMVGAVNASFSTLVEPVTSVLCSVIFYGDKLALLSVLGFALIFISVGLNSHKEVEGEKESLA